ncbi:MAG: ferrochelatase [Alphaproteobacteria bacterium]|nr:ferrochelatase [Alphaproteobacteria bacterium]
MKIAVVLFNLGGPETLDDVEPFLFNLFSDPAILRVPGFLRSPLAWFIARRRAVIARDIYAKIGGGSPILGQTKAQAAALEQALEQEELAAETFIVMRYASPRAADVVRDVKAFAPDRIVLLPLYPQFSTTTSGSSLAEWETEAAKIGLRAPTSEVCCYPIETGFIEAQTALINEAISTLPADVKFRLLLSAHGLPKRVVAGGDPYQAQVEQTAKAIVGALEREGLDWSVCYQSRVGPLQWIGPATDAEIKRAGGEGLSVVIAPIAFVSEHSETLVELDIEYAHLAREAGVPTYLRVPAVGTQANFIGGLAQLVKDALTVDGVLPAGGQRICPATCKQCELDRRAA